ncbi:MAG: GvpL/GvpF family gas vesicle protein [Deltaproteobacteria bacterium]|nr:GvpL/GvpF family gas vesicle protein [Deltaproteobacteria bacterium]
MKGAIQYIPAYLPKGRYLYGIIRAEGKPDLPSIGLRRAKVYTVNFKNIAAVVSDHPLIKIRPVREDLTSHHEVIKEVIKNFTIIPMAFGHIVRSAGELRRVLEVNYPRIDQELERLCNKVEMSLRILWDVDNIFEYFLNRDRELRDFRDTIFGRSRQPTQGEKIELGRLFESKLNQERQKHAERVLKVLSGYTVDAKINPPTHEKMVMNGVFLVEKGKEGLFEGAVHRVAALFDGNFTFDYSGPWAPHNFIELELAELGSLTHYKMKIANCKNQNGVHS